MNRRLAFLINMAIFMVATCPASAKTQLACSLLSQSALIQAAMGQQESPAHARITRIDKNLMPDFVEVTPTLYRGGDGKKGGIYAVANIGVQSCGGVPGERDVVLPEGECHVIKHVG